MSNDYALKKRQGFLKSVIELFNNLFINKILTKQTNLTV